MGNGESKIAIFKAALCCGFAIALRALFLGILYPLPCGGGRGWVVMLSVSETSLFVIASEPIGRARQSNVCKARIMGILCLLIASLALAMTQ